VYFPDTYDYSPFNASVQAQFYNNSHGAGNCVDQIKDCVARGINEICSAAVSLRETAQLCLLTCIPQDSFCANLVESVYDNYLGRDEYDVRELTPDPFPYGFYVTYLNSPKIQAAIGAYQNFSDSSNIVYQAFTAAGDDNREVRIIEALRKLIRQNVTVILYVGDADYKLANLVL
jgi:carboxypeptidase D